MAKSRKHRRHYGKHKRRHMHGFKGFGDLLDLKKSVRLSSPVAGIAAGLGVGLGLKALASSTSALQSLPVALQNNLVPLGAVLGGGALYFARKKKDHSAAIGNLAGAVAAGAVVLAWDYLQTSAPQLFSGAVQVTLANGLKATALKGLLISNPTPANSPFRGMLVRNPMRGVIVPSNPLDPTPRNLQQYVGGGEVDYDEINAP